MSLQKKCSENKQKTARTKSSVIIQNFSMNAHLQKMFRIDVCSNTNHWFERFCWHSAGGLILSLELATSKMPHIQCIFIFSQQWSSVALQRQYSVHNSFLINDHSIKLSSADGKDLEIQFLLLRNFFKMQNCNIILLSIILSSYNVLATEFTFDLMDSAEECFYELIENNITCTLDYHVRL